MKKLTVCVCSAILFATTINAQSEKMVDANKMSTVKPMQDSSILKNAVMMKEGKMIVMKDGKATAMDKDLDLANGDRIMIDGTIKTKDGTTRQLQEGEGVYMDGKMIPAVRKPMQKDTVPM